MKEYKVIFADLYGTLIENRVSSRGEMIKGVGECTFFPSREQRDWSKFTAPWYYINYEKRRRNKVCK